MVRGVNRNMFKQPVITLYALAMSLFFILIPSVSSADEDFFLTGFKKSEVDRFKSAYKSDIALWSTIDGLICDVVLSYKGSDGKPGPTFSATLSVEATMPDEEAVARGATYGYYNVILEDKEKRWKYSSDLKNNGTIFETKDPAQTAELRRWLDTNISYAINAPLVLLRDATTTSNDIDEVLNVRFREHKLSQNPEADARDSQAFTLQHGTGNTITDYFSGGHYAGMTKTIKDGAKEVTYKLRYRDYADFSGIIFPTAIEILMRNGTECFMHFNSVKKR